MRITKQQLRRIILETMLTSDELALVLPTLNEEEYYHKLPKNHVDGLPWSGSIEDLADEQGRTWGHGALVNKKEYKKQIKKAIDLSNGNDGSPLRTTRGHLSEMIRKIVRDYYEY